MCVYVKKETEHCRRIIMLKLLSAGDGAMD